MLRSSRNSSYFMEPKGSFTRVSDFFLHWARYIQFTPSLSICVRSILILPSHLRQVIDSGHFLSGISPKYFMHFFHFLCMIYAPPNSLSWFDNLHEIFGEKYKLWSFSFSNFLRSHVISYLLCPTAVFSTLLFIHP